MGEEDVVLLGRVDAAFGGRPYSMKIEKNWKILYRKWRNKLTYCQFFFLLNVKIDTDEVEFASGGKMVFNWPPSEGITR